MLSSRVVGNGDVPRPRGTTAIEIANEAFRVAWRADQHGVDLHASVVSHLAGTDNELRELSSRVESLDRDVRQALRELGHVRDRTPSVHDIAEAAATAAADAVGGVREHTLPGIGPRTKTESDRVRETIALDSQERWVKLRDSVVSAVVGGLVLAGAFELIRILAAHH